MVSFIVPCYNQANYMRETLDCLKQQTLADWECIIVNDGSTDNTLEIAKEYVESDIRYILVDKPNGGLADARNAGIRASHGEYILPLDSDDLIDPTYAEKATCYLEKHPEVKLVYCRARYLGDRDDEWLLPEYNYQDLLFGNMIFCSCVYRRSDYDKTEGYNTNMAKGLEDWNFLLSFLDESSKVYKIPEILFYYRKHGESMISGLEKYKNEMHNKMVANHIDLYYPYLHRVITSSREIAYWQNEFDKILHSNSYRLGHLLFAPFKLFKSLKFVSRKQ